MNRRLQQFLEVEQLSPARLADSLGIQRSGISHILSGRNKPSYEFLKIFLMKYPRVDSSWLITGKGKMYRDESPLSSDCDNTPPDGKILFEDAEKIEILEDNNQQKKVKRVTLYYSDGSFEDFYPSK